MGQQSINEVITTAEKKNIQFLLLRRKNAFKSSGKNTVRIDLLPSPSEIQELYQKAGIPEQKAISVSRNYQTKIEMVRDLQKGATVSLYREKKKR